MSAGEIVVSVFLYASIALDSLLGLSACLLGLLIFSTIQAHFVYLHAGQMTWFKDLDVPEVFGFLHS